MWTVDRGTGDWKVPNYPGHEVRIAWCACVCVSCVRVCVRARARARARDDGRGTRDGARKERVAVRFSRPRSLFCGAREGPLPNALKAAPLQIRPTFFLQFFPEQNLFFPPTSFFMPRHDNTTKASQLTLRARLRGTQAFCLCHGR